MPKEAKEIRSYADIYSCFTKPELYIIAAHFVLMIAPRYTTSGPVQPLVILLLNISLQIRHFQTVLQDGKKAADSPLVIQVSFSRMVEAISNIYSNYWLRFILPFSDGTYYGMVMSVYPSGSPFVILSVRLSLRLSVVRIFSKCVKILSRIFAYVKHVF